MEDFSLRQAKTIAACDILLTEDTRTTGIMLPRLVSMFNVVLKPEQKIVSYYKDKEFEKLPFILEMLLQGKDIAIISEAGMPLISDPGYLLVSTAIKQKIPFTVIPGPTAETTAIVYSGFDPHTHMFLGFLPKRENLIVRFLQKIQQFREIIPEVAFVCYESPERINATLRLLDANLPGCRVCICRELTKKFEEVARGKPADFFETEFRGEITLVFK